MRKDKIPVSLLQWEKALGMVVFSNILPDKSQFILAKANTPKLDIPLVKCYNIRKNQIFFKKTKIPLRKDLLITQRNMIK